MVAHFTMRTYEVNPEFRCDEGIWLHCLMHYYLIKVPWEGSVVDSILHVGLGHRGQGHWR